MNPVLEEIVKTRRVRPIDGGEGIPVHSEISEEDGLFLKIWFAKSTPW